MPFQTVVTVDDLDGIVNDIDILNRIVVRENVLVSADTGDAISFAAGLSSVQVSGMVAAVQGAAIRMGNSTSPVGLGNNMVSIADSGVVTAMNNRAIDLSSGFNYVVNAGSVSSQVSAAILLSGQNCTLMNSGEIMAINQTVLFSANADFSTNLFTNTGLVAAASQVATAFVSFQGVDQVYNRGTIAGSMDFYSGDDLFDNEVGLVTGTIRLGAGNDEMTGGSTREVAMGETGDDRLDFGGGDDRFVAGNTESLPSDGNDDLDGGDGIDTYDARAIATSVIVRLNEQRAVGVEVDRDLLVGFENVIGGDGNDTLVGDGGRNMLRGGNGVDNINGLEGNDRLLGGNGNDGLTGNAGRDVMTGGANFDLFDFNAVTDSGVGDSVRDIITDFVQGFDLIDLNTIDADTVAGGNQNFVFIGTAAFTSVAGQLRYSNSVATQYTTVEGDVNGDGRADFQIGLFRSLALLANDFVL